MAKIRKEKEYNRFIDEYILNPNIVALNIPACSDELKVDRNTIYEWLKREETIALLDGDKGRKRVERRKALHLACLEGNPQAIKLEEQILEGFSERIQQDVSGEISIDANALADAVDKIRSKKSAK